MPNSRFITVPRNFDPDLHPFEAAREYVRALNAVKLERVFAKPFVTSLDGHRDAVSCIAKNPTELSVLVSASYDGEVRVWDLAQRKCLRDFLAHEGVIRGVTYIPDGNQFITLADDKTIKTWKTQMPQFGEDEEPVNTILSKTVIGGISHCVRGTKFATCGEVCQLWEQTRNEPIRTYQWGVDSLHDVRFNPVECNILAACASDRSIILYDTRDSGPIRKVVMKMRTNRLSWNPMEAFVFTSANEDYK